MHSTLCPSVGCGSEGVVTSPNHPEGYGNNIQKTQTIRVQQGLIVSLHFTVFALDMGDYLSITDGDGTTLMGRTKGYSKPANRTSKTNVVKLLFTTNAGDGRTGWSVNWSAVTPGVLTFPNNACYRHSIKYGHF
jgi:cubilin